MKLYITSRILSKEMLPQLIYFIFYSNVKHLFKNLIFPEIKMKYRQFYLFFVYNLKKKIFSKKKKLEFINQIKCRKIIDQN